MIVDATVVPSGDSDKRFLAITVTHHRSGSYNPATAELQLRHAFTPFHGSFEGLPHGTAAETWQPIAVTAGHLTKCNNAWRHSQRLMEVRV